MRSVPSISALTAGISFSAWVQAFTKKPMKPSFTPCFFSNRSLYWLRRLISGCMSTSLKVVSMAAVFWASFRRRAMVWRSLVILTRSSRAASLTGDGARTATGAGAAAAGGLAAIGQHVALEHLAALARAGDVVDVDAAIGGVLGGGRRGRRAGAGRRGSGRGRRSRGRQRRTAAGAAAAPAPSAIWPSSAPGVDGLAVLGDDFRQHAGGRRVDLERDLVGFELDQGLVGLDGVAGLLEPAADGRFGNGFAEGGNADFSGHVITSAA